MHIVVIQKMYKRLWIKERENLFFIDVQSRGEYPGYAKRFLRENGIELVFGENDEEILKE